MISVSWPRGNSGSEAILTLPSISSKLNGRSRRKYIRWGLIGGNFLLLLSIGIFVLVNRSASQTLRTSNANSAIATSSSVSTPLDQLSSAQIALQAAQMTGIAELTAVRNQADSEYALTAFVPNDATTLSKPQIVSTALKSRLDIIRYVVKKGDTVDSVASKFNLTVGSVTGSNNLASTALQPGKTILLPPANGIIYRVKAGDSIGRIISKYGADRELTILVNDAENGVKAGEYIWIPNVSQPSVAPSSYGQSFVSSAFTPTFGYNGYDYGFCTWYVASRIPVPSNWGNANTWDDYARRTPGWGVSTIPSVGAIAQTDGGWEGHVAIVTAVSGDRTKMKYADMNGIAGWGRVGYSDWVSASRFPHYIVQL